jgi:HTH-like domain
VSPAPCSAHRRRSERSCISCGARTVDCGWSGRFSQRRPPGSLGRRTRSHRRVPVREPSPGGPSDCQHVSAAGCLLPWLLCVGEATAVAAAARDAPLLAEIHAAHTASGGTYGAPRIRAELAAKGIPVGRKRVARLMSLAGLAGVSRRKFVVTTVKGDGRQAPYLVERDFHDGSARPAVGRGHHIHPDLGRLPLSRGRARIQIESSDTSTTT